jgi:pimeloyl-ACP methyl ester carboxylesterase
MRLRLSVLLYPLAVLLLAACSTGGDVRRPIPVRLVPATQPAHRLVVVLPGRGDDLDSLTRRGIDRIVHSQWPDADVVLTGLTLPFYRQGRAVRRLHEEILRPAHARHYGQVWLAGISLGGLGALMYDRAYPGEVDGMLLVSPYLGDMPIYREIRAAGGLARWQPGPAQPVTPETYQRELWRHIRDLRDGPGSASVWLAYGDRERFRDRIALLATWLPSEQVFELPGHHNWTLWKTALRTLLAHARPGQPRPDTAPATRAAAGAPPLR